MALDSPPAFDTLESHPAASGVHRSRPQVLLISPEALRTLQRKLFESVGGLATRDALTQMGFSEGGQWALSHERTGDQSEQEGHSEADLASVGLRSGWFQVVEASGDSPAQKGVRLIDSREARQHLADFGQAAQPVCSALSGFLSGYFSRLAGQDLVAVEQACQACGAPSCEFEVQTRRQWADRAPDSAAAGLRESLHSSPVSTAGDAGLEVRDEARGLPFLDTTDAGLLALVTESPQMQQTVRLAQRLAKVDSTVLISGESGTGKERIARLLHHESSRRDKPFIAVNCGAIPEGLIESELFGHARGSFSGAIQAHMGMFEAAHEGTILLDEIGEISPALQLKLLRVLQEREVRRVGEEKSRPIDFRVIAATNRDLAEQVELGLFRRDLYYRLHVVEITVPPLRTRRQDILHLARQLLAGASGRMNRSVFGFSPEVVERLLEYSWPGNVRELENAMERAVALASGTRVELEDLPAEVTNLCPDAPEKLESVRPLQDISKDYILAALDLNYGNQTHTARQLGIGTATLYRKLKQYGHLDND